MADYISKEFMLKNLEADKMNNAEHCEPVTVQIMERFIRYVKEFPSADVQPVKRGKWKQIAPQSAICSQCGGALKSNGIDKTGKGYIFKAVYKYCPYCGARMDGGAKND